MTTTKGFLNNKCRIKMTFHGHKSQNEQTCLGLLVRKDLQHSACSIPTLHLSNQYQDKFVLLSFAHVQEMSVCSQILVIMKSVWGLTFLPNLMQYFSVLGPEASLNFD